MFITLNTITFTFYISSNLTPVDAAVMAVVVVVIAVTKAAVTLLGQLHRLRGWVGKDLIK